MQIQNGKIRNRNKRNKQILNKNICKQEVLYRNILFESCGSGVTIQDWNSLEHTFDGCLFRNNGAGIAATKGNSYIRNTRFENSSDVDISLEIFWSFSTVQRVVSFGSNQFLRGGGAVSILEVYVEGWRGLQPTRPARCFEWLGHFNANLQCGVMRSMIPIALGLGSLGLPKPPFPLPRA